jgi:hypothetical protein
MPEPRNELRRRESPRRRILMRNFQALERDLAAKQR